MTKHRFLSDWGGGPSPRWRAAFADGPCGPEREALAGLGAGDVIWLQLPSAGWEPRLRELAQAHPANALAVLSLSPSDAECVCALECGARAYCHALAVTSQLQEVAAVLGHGGLWVGPSLLARALAGASRALPPAAGSPALDGLSPREAEVARAIAQAKSNKQIALELGITERTVKAHVAAIFDKLGVRDRLQLVLLLSERSAANALAQQ